MRPFTQILLRHLFRKWDLSHKFYYGTCSGSETFHTNFITAHVQEMRPFTVLGGYLIFFGWKLQSIVLTRLQDTLRKTSLKMKIYSTKEYQSSVGYPITAQYCGLAHFFKWLVYLSAGYLGVLVNQSWLEADYSRHEMAVDQAHSDKPINF